MNRFQTLLSKFNLRRYEEDRPYAREVGHVGEGAGDALSAELMEGHDVPRVVLADVVHWLRKRCMTGQVNPLQGTALQGNPLVELHVFRRAALEGARRGGAG